MVVDKEVQKVEHQVEDIKVKKQDQAMGNLHQDSKVVKLPYIDYSPRGDL